MTALPTTKAVMSIPAYGLCLTLRFEYGHWSMSLYNKSSKRMVAFVSSVGTQKPPRFREEDGIYEIWLGEPGSATCFELQKRSWEKLKAWVDHVTNAMQEGDNRGVSAGVSHTVPDAAAGKPDAAVEGELQPSPHDDAPPGLQQAAGRQALPVQIETPAVPEIITDAVASIQYHARMCEEALLVADAAEQRIGAGMATGHRRLAAKHSDYAFQLSRSLAHARGAA